MRILLVGEYSRLHNSLKEGLLTLGHDVTILSSGDGFKNYASDITISHRYKTGFLKKFKNLIYKLTKIDLASIQTYKKAKKALNKLGYFDVIQLINESSLKTQAKYELCFVKQLKQHSKNLFILACGEDYTTSSYFIAGKPRYSILTPYLKDKSLKNVFINQFETVNPQYKKLHESLAKLTQGYIASDIDYHLPYLEKENYLGLIPNPINTDKIEVIPFKTPDKIIIFHGINTGSQHKKGNHFFSKALEKIQKKYTDKVEIITSENIPYQKYIKSYNSCHILLDQVLCFDQGYNALEAMAKGKVVFTGAEKEWLDYYGLEENTVAINALPDVEYLVKMLEWLILNPEKLVEISLKARTFIEKEHNYINIAKRYVNLWNANSFTV